MAGVAQGWPQARAKEYQTMAEGLMAGKRGLIMGVANNRSIAWGIAKAVADQGAELAFTYQGEALEKRVRPLAASIGNDFLIECDVTDDAELDNTFAQIEKRWGRLDFVVHAIAHSNKDELKGRYVDTSAENFRTTMLDRKRTSMNSSTSCDNSMPSSA